MKKGKRRNQPKDTWKTEQAFYKERLHTLQCVINAVEVAEDSSNKVLYNYRERPKDELNKDTRDWLLAEIKDARACLEQLYDLSDNARTKEQLLKVIRDNGNARFAKDR